MINDRNSHDSSEKDSDSIALLPICHKRHAINRTAKSEKDNMKGMQRNQIDGERIWMPRDLMECIAINCDQNDYSLAITLP
jgi:hypothetical protein